MARKCNLRKKAETRIKRLSKKLAKMAFNKKKAEQIAKQNINPQEKNFRFWGSQI